MYVAWQKQGAGALSVIEQLLRNAPAPCCYCGIIHLFLQMDEFCFDIVSNDEEDSEFAVSFDLDSEGELPSPKRSRLSYGLGKAGRPCARPVSYTL